MLVGIGNDLLEVARMRRELARAGGGFRDDVFTVAEIAYCEARRHPARHFAARFAAKEAFLKALGTGVGSWPVWREIEVVNGPHGEPGLVLSGGARRLAGRRKVRRALLSMSHTGTMAMASVVLEA